MKKVCILTILMIVVLLPLSSQSFEQKQKQFEKQFNDYKKKKQDEFSAYYNRMNVEYANYLKRAWKERDMIKGEEKPKEEIVPPIKYEGEDKEDRQQEAIVIEKQIVEPSPKPHIPDPVKPAVDTVHKFSYYGVELACRFPKSNRIHILNLSPEVIASAWTTMSDECYYNLIQDCLKIRDSLKLCDWAYLNMLDSLAINVYGNGNDATFVQAYLFSKSGYAMRLGNVDNHLVMLVGSKYIMFNMNYIVKDDMFFYAIGEDTYKVKISDAKFDGEKPVEMMMPDEQAITFFPTENREMKSEMGIVANCSVNRNIIDFYNHYPTPGMEFENSYAIDWKLYAHTPMDKEVSDILYPQLRDAIKNKNELEAVNILLNWVQTSFDYQYDDSVWGCDRAFFPSETLYYPYCDCEDRSILFTRLVRDLLNLDVALVYYPGHLAAAVRFNDAVKGDYFLADGQRYTVCDPTYIGAPVGLSMRMMRKDLAKLIKL